MGVYFHEVWLSRTYLRWFYNMTESRSQTSNGRYDPRAVPVDLDPEAIDAVRSGDCGN